MYNIDRVRLGSRELLEISQQR